MKKRVVFAALAVASLGLGGCAGMASPGAGLNPDRPLEAYLFADPGFGLSFDLNKPAHVAVFRIVPGRGSQMLYPRPGLASSDGFSFAGLQNISLLGRGSDYSFLPAMGIAGPEFYYLIASEEPLRLDRIGPYGDGLRMSMGAFFASGSAYTAMERLAEITVPNPGSNDWTTDFYVHWPQTLFPRYRPDLVAIRCGDYTAYVPLERVVEATQILCEAQESEETNEQRPQVPTDSAEVIEPQRRRPVDPVSERIASTQLERPEEFELRRRAAVAGERVDAEDLEALDRPGDRIFGTDGFRENPAIGAGRGAAVDRRGSGDSRGSSSAEPARRPSPPPAPRAEPSAGSGSGISPASPAPAAPAGRPSVRENPSL